MLANSLFDIDKRVKHKFIHNWCSKRCLYGMLRRVTIFNRFKEWLVVNKHALNALYYCICSDIKFLNIFSYLFRSLRMCGMIFIEKIKIKFRLDGKKGFEIDF